MASYELSVAIERYKYVVYDSISLGSEVFLFLISQDEKKCKV